MRGYAEYAVYAFCLLLFAASSIFLGLNVLLIALAFITLGIALFKRSNALSFAALLAYSAAAALANVSLTLGNIVVFGLLSLLPFFVCFRIAGSRVRGTIPWEAAAVVLPVLVAAALLLLNIGPILSSEQALMPEWLLAFSLLVLAAALLSIPLAAEAANLFKSPTG